MPKIKHIAMTAKDPQKVAAFYMELFGMEEVGRSGDSHVYLSDGEMNLTIRSCKADGDADVGEGGAGFEGIHHIGFVVDDVEEYSEKALKIGAKMLSRGRRSKYRCWSASRQTGQEQCRGQDQRSQRSGAGHVGDWLDRQLAGFSVSRFYES